MYYIIYMKICKSWHIIPSLEQILSRRQQHTNGNTYITRKEILLPWVSKAPLEGKPPKWVTRTRYASGSIRWWFLEVTMSGKLAAASTTMIKLWQFVISHKVKFSIRLWVSCHTQQRSKVCIRGQFKRSIVLSLEKAWTLKENQGARD